MHAQLHSGVRCLLFGLSLHPLAFILNKMNGIGHLKSGSAGETGGMCRPDSELVYWLPDAIIKVTKSHAGLHYFWFKSLIGIKYTQLTHKN